jgi:hypothetical protein
MLKFLKLWLAAIFGLSLIAVAVIGPLVAFAYYGPIIGLPALIVVGGFFLAVVES